MTWPTNPYLDAFLRTDDGQAYLLKYGNLDAWRRRHLLDELPVVPDTAVPENTFFLLDKPRAMGWTSIKPRFSVVRVDNVMTDDPWDF